MESMWYNVSYENENDLNSEYLRIDCFSSCIDFLIHYFLQLFPFHLDVGVTSIDAKIAEVLHDVQWPHSHFAGLPGAP
jgi:hypothetical protein